MNTAVPRQPPRFVPTLTEVVSASAAPAEVPEAGPVSPEAVHAVDLAAQIDQKINEWLDRWLAEQAPVLVEQMLAQLTAQLRLSLQQQALETVAQVIQPAHPGGNAGSTVG